MGVQEPLRTGAVGRLEGLGDGRSKAEQASDHLLS